MKAYRFGETAYFAGRADKKTYTIIRCTFRLFAYSAANHLRMPKKKWKSPMNEEYETEAEAEAALETAARRRNWERIDMEQVKEAYRNDAHGSRD